MRRLWLIFAQTVTVGLAVLFVVSTLKPEWLGKRPRPAASVVACRSRRWPPCQQLLPRLVRDAAKKALPSVVHIFTSQKIKARRNPLFDDPVFRHFFGDSPKGRVRRPPGSVRESLSARTAIFSRTFMLSKLPTRSRSPSATAATSMPAWSAVTRSPTSPSCRSPSRTARNWSCRRSPSGKWRMSWWVTSRWPSAILSGLVRR
jgi:S1-C subfamily serine protease